MNKPWKTVKKNIIYQNKYGYTLYDNDVINPAGKKGKYMVLENHDFVVIIAITPEKKIVMIRQWRYPIDRESLELPAGSIDAGEDKLKCAKRELLEETGYSSSEWSEIKSYWIGNGAIKIKGRIFLAKNAIKTDDTNHEETENIVSELYSYPELERMIENNFIDDERSLIGLLLLPKYL